MLRGCCRFSRRTLSCELGERFASQESERLSPNIQEGPVPNGDNPEVINVILDQYRDALVGSVRSDPLIHSSVAAAVHELLDFLEVERKRVPGDVLRDAERLECLLFSGYDPHFEGDEPPGL